MAGIVFSTEFYNKLDSTNEVLSQKIGQKNFHGAVVYTDFQTKGQGRNNRVWLSHPQNLAFSVGFCLSGEEERAVPYYALGSIVCIYDAISPYLKDISELSVKWPNDIAWQKQKLVGVLSRTYKKEEKIYISVGVGINIGWAPKNMNAICLKEIPLKRALPPKKEWLGEILKNIESTYSSWQNFLFIRKKWERRAKFLGSPVRFGLLEKGAEMEQAIAIGLTESGSLKVQLKSGEEKELFTEDLSLRL